MHEMIWRQYCSQVKRDVAAGKNGGEQKEDQPTSLDATPREILENSPGENAAPVRNVVRRRGVKSRTFAMIMFSWTLFQNRRACHMSKIQLVVLFAHGFRAYCRDVSGKRRLSRFLSCASWALGLLLMFLTLSTTAFYCTKYVGCIRQLTQVVAHMILWVLVRKPYLAAYLAALLDLVLNSLTDAKNWPLYLNFRLCQMLVLAPMAFVFVKATFKGIIILLIVTYAATGVLITHRDPVLWLFGFVFGKGLIRHAFLFSTWLVVSLVSIVLAFILRPPLLRKTEVRKVYHFAAAFIMFSGLLVDPSFLRIALSGALFTVEMAESCRYHAVPLFGKIVQSVFRPFLTNEDDPEAAEIAPISLLFGLGYPLLYEPILESTMGFKQRRMRAYVYAGVLSTGIGDSFAAIVGSRWGRRKWPENKRTVEGSIACFSSELVAILFILLITRQLTSLSLSSVMKMNAGLLASTIFEALSTADDNFLGSVVLYPFLRSAFPMPERRCCELDGGAPRC